MISADGQAEGCGALCQLCHLLDSITGMKLGLGFLHRLNKTRTLEKHFTVSDAMMRVGNYALSEHSTFWLTAHLSWLLPLYPIFREGQRAMAPPQAHHFCSVYFWTGCTICFKLPQQPSTWRGCLHSHLAYLLNQTLRVLGDDPVSTIKRQDLWQTRLSNKQQCKDRTSQWIAAASFSIMEYLVSREYSYLLRNMVVGFHSVVFLTQYCSQSNVWYVSIYNKGPVKVSPFQHLWPR